MQYSAKSLYRSNDFYNTSTYVQSCQTGEQQSQNQQYLKCLIEGCIKCDSNQNCLDCAENLMIDFRNNQCSLKQSICSSKFDFIQYPFTSDQCVQNCQSSFHKNENTQICEKTPQCIQFDSISSYLNQRVIKIDQEFQIIYTQVLQNVTNFQQKCMFNGKEYNNKSLIFGKYGGQIKSEFVHFRQEVVLIFDEFKIFTIPSVLMLKGIFILQIQSFAEFMALKLRGDMSYLNKIKQDSKEVIFRSTLQLIQKKSNSVLEQHDKLRFQTTDSQNKKLNAHQMKEKVENTIQDLIPDFIINQKIINQHNNSKQTLNSNALYQVKQHSFLDNQNEKSSNSIVNTFLKSIQQIIPEGLAVIDSTKQIIYSNKTLQCILQCKNNKDLQQILLNLDQFNANNYDKNLEQENKDKTSILFNSNYLREVTIQKNSQCTQSLVNFTNIQEKINKRNCHNNRLNVLSANNLSNNLSSSVAAVRNLFEKSYSDFFQKKPSLLQQKTEKEYYKTYSQEVNKKTQNFQALFKYEKEFVSYEKNKQEKQAHFKKDEADCQIQINKKLNESEVERQENQYKIQIQIYPDIKLKIQNNDNETQISQVKKQSKNQQQVCDKVLSIVVDDKNKCGTYQIAKEINNKNINYQLDSNNNFQGLQRILNQIQNQQHAQTDNQQTLEQKTNQNIVAENKKTIAHLQNFCDDNLKVTKPFHLQIRPLSIIMNEITKKKINFTNIFDSLFKDKSRKNTLDQIENKLLGHYTQTQTELNTHLNYIQQTENATKFQVTHKSKDLIIQLITIDLFVEDQKFQEPLVLIIVQEPWQDLYQKKVEELQKQKMKVFVTLSHELRTPLNCSISMLEVLKDELSLEEINQLQREEYINPALFSNKLFLNQINDILDFVQMDCGKFKYSFLDFNVVSLLKDCSKLVSMQAKMKNLDVFVTYDQKINQIICSDPNRIRQILLNFLSNSLKFTKSGYIELAFLQVSNQIYQIYVKDTGIGISKDNLNKIFNFCNKIEYKSKEEEQLNKQGCGLGLIISNSLANGLVNSESCSGGVSVESEYALGSKFSILVEDFNSNVNKINEIQVNSNKPANNSLKPIQNQISSLIAQQYEQKNSISSYQNNILNCQQYIYSSNQINENDISQIEKQNNSVYTFIQEDLNFNISFDKHQSSNRENITNDSKIEVFNIPNKGKQYKQDNYNISSSQVIEDTQITQELKFNLCKIFQIQTHKNFQEDETHEFKNKTQHMISLKVQPCSSLFQSSCFCQFKQNSDHTSTNKLDQPALQKFSQNQTDENQMRKITKMTQILNQNQHDLEFTNSDCSNNTYFEIKNQSSDNASIGKKIQNAQRIYQNYVSKRRSFQNSNLQVEIKEENAQYEQEGFTSYASSKKIKAQFTSYQKIPTSSLTNEKFEKCQSVKSLFSCNKTTNIEIYAEINKNQKPQTVQQKIDDILENNQDKKINCRCPQIKIVDNNQFNLYAMQKIIQQFQFEIIAFSDGNQAIQFIKSQFFKNYCYSPQMILMDIEMSIKNGYETVQEIIQLYKNLQYGNIPVIVACTSYVGQQDYDQCIQSGMHDFINKPILKAAFQNLILAYKNIFCIQN
ncbi:hypothetical protein ABPG72_003269 [Tetrahymena utriculariae]